MVLGGLMFLAWPLVLFVLKDRPSDMGQFPDGDRLPGGGGESQSRTFQDLLRSYPFWLLLIGSLCSIGSIGAMNFHMKFVFLDQGFIRQDPVLELHLADGLDPDFLVEHRRAACRLAGLADRFSKKWVMTVTYFMVAATIPLLLAGASGEGHSALHFRRSSSDSAWAPTTC